MESWKMEGKSYPPPIHPMKKLPDWLDLNLPDAPGVDLPPPVLTVEERDLFLTQMHEENVRTGAYRRPLTSLNQPFSGMFVLLD